MDQDIKLSVKFFSNHNDLSFIKDRFPLDEVSFINHGLIDPDWDMDRLEKECQNRIDEAINCDILIINGDYSLVSLIVSKRLALKKKTGFICMKKLSVPEDSSKDTNGIISHTNRLIPCNIRYIG
jgi:hypothetical protein